MRAVAALAGAVLAAAGANPVEVAAGGPAPATPAKPWVIAHRGGMARWPENTLYAFRQALAAGADVLDLDLRRSADGALVVIHDAEVDRVTDGTGRVAELTLRELRALDAGFRWSDDGGRRHPHRGQGLVVPTLDEVLAALPGARLQIEIKPDGPELAVALCAAIRHRDAQGRALVASFRAAVVEAFRDACPEVASAATVGEVARFLLRERLGRPPRAPPARPVLIVPIRALGIEIPRASFVRAARRVGLRVHAFTANSAAEVRRLVEAGVDGILGDDPVRLRTLLERGGAPPSEAAGRR